MTSHHTVPKCCTCCCSKTGTFLIYLWIAVLSFTISAMQWIYQEPAFYDPYIYRPISEDHFSHIRHSSQLLSSSSSSKQRWNLSIHSSSYSNSAQSSFSSHNSSPSFSHIIYFNRFNTTTFVKQQPVSSTSSTSSESLNSQFSHTFQLFEMVTIQSNMNHDYFFETNHFTSLIVQFHGYAEYSERYTFFYERFFSLKKESISTANHTEFDNLSKIAIYSYDLRGHGYSSGNGRSFWRTSHEHLQDIETVICERIPFILNSVLKSPNAKVYLMAHSTSALNILTFDYLKKGRTHHENSEQVETSENFSFQCSKFQQQGEPLHKLSTHSRASDDSLLKASPNSETASSERTSTDQLASRKFTPLMTLKTMIPNFGGIILTSPSIALKGFYNDFWSRKSPSSSSRDTLHRSATTRPQHHENTLRNHLNIYSSSNREEVEAEHEVSSFFEMQIYLVKYLMLPLFPSLPIYPSFGALCLHPKCLQRYKDDRIMYKGPWKVGPWVSILEQMRNVVLYLRYHAITVDVRKDAGNHDHTMNRSRCTAITPPVLIMHGEGDKLFDWSRTRALFENYFGNRMQWKSYENLGHDLWHEEDNIQIARDLYHFVSNPDNHHERGNV
ncbi:hypothetical protein C9374_002892 [Naegleria lovaniensis]|uniref:Serine aminopeptidase S33 domain-containing protein n=1 Tax=Naegleria lovaniensis TaxID=51637 RepID=A0AA88GT26_NAELO|nr:uncharacterized protein C9374_002892 [Naegleria lovaniensis]KAG2385743.1 hypothetical protein C9374_002892 [Naegleria lovaniensis]